MTVLSLVAAAGLALALPAGYVVGGHPSSTALMVFWGAAAIVVGAAFVLI